MPIGIDISQTFFCAAGIEPEPASGELHQKRRSSFPQPMASQELSDMQNSKQNPSVSPSGTTKPVKKLAPSADDEAAPQTCAEAACSPSAFIGWGFLFSVLYCVVVAVATHLHWPNNETSTLYEASTLCAFPPLQDNNTGVPIDYPNPRCPDSSRFGQDQGAYWYYWRSKDFVWYSQVTAWVFYLLHQFGHWGVIYYAQARLSSDKSIHMTPAGNGAPGIPRGAEPKYTNKMRPWNWWAFGINGFFCVMHLLQTHFMGYDALAPSVHEMASQGSVIVMLVIVMMMETDRRGMWFGQPQSLFNEALDVAKRYHGYIFSWAVIFTFWYHPMEGYLGFLFGIMHVLIIMVQGSLIFTNAHLNRVWRMVLEAWVFLHATVISTQTLSSNSWPMFCFGFGAIFVISQLPGLPSLQRCHFAVRLVPAIVFAVLYVTCFVLIDAWTSFPVVFFIPAAIYLGAIGLNLFVMLMLVAGRACCAARCSAKAGERPKSTTASTAGFLVLALVLMGVVMACAVVGEVVLDRHSLEATIVVYGGLVVGIVFLLPVLMCALPRPQDEERRNGCVQCCCWKRPQCCVKAFPCCNGDEPVAAPAASGDAVSEDRGTASVELTVASGSGGGGGGGDPAVAKTEEASR